MVRRGIWAVLMMWVVSAVGCSDDETTGSGGSSTGGAGATTGSASGGHGGTLASAPLAPSGVTAEPMDGGLHVTWVDESDNEDNFVVERHDGSGDFEEVVVLPFDSTSHHDAPLTSGTPYTYRIGARNQAGTSYSAEVSAQAP
jgi:hypothetical protein